MKPERIEAYLSAPEIAAVAYLAGKLGVSLSVWPARRAFEGWLISAILRATDYALASNRADDFTPALRFVCGDFQLEFETVRSLLKRRGFRVQVEPHATPSTR